MGLTVTGFCGMADGEEKTLILQKISEWQYGHEQQAVARASTKGIQEIEKIDDKKTPSEGVWG